MAEPIISEQQARLQVLMVLKPFIQGRYGIELDDQTIQKIVEALMEYVAQLDIPFESHPKLARISVRPPEYDGMFAGIFLLYEKNEEGKEIPALDETTRLILKTTDARNCTDVYV